jgi:hypothetical protein
MYMCGQKSVIASASPIEPCQLRERVRVFELHETKADDQHNLHRSVLSSTPTFQYLNMFDCTTTILGVYQSFNLQCIADIRGSYSKPRDALR